MQSRNLLILRSFLPLQIHKVHFRTSDRNDSDFKNGENLGVHCTVLQMSRAMRRGAELVDIDRGLKSPCLDKLFCCPNVLEVKIVKLIFGVRFVKCYRSYFVSKSFKMC